jgi:hypothetical protein
MTWGKHKTQGKGKPNVNRIQKNPERKKNETEMDTAPVGSW